jgi:hypothetical protein
MQLDQPVAPNLPLASPEYDARYQEQFNRVLRLYFNRLSNALISLLGLRGGQYLSFPYGAFSSTADQTLGAVNTPTAVTYTTTDAASGVSFSDSSRIYVAQTGVYNLQFSLQFANTNTSIHNAFVWIRVNGVDVSATASKFDVTAKHGGSDGYIIAACNFYVPATGGDYIELMWASESTSVYIEAYAAQTSPFVMPSVPSSVVTLTFVSTTT